MNRLPHASLFRRDIVLHQVEMTRVKCDEKRFLKLVSTAVLLYRTRLSVWSMWGRRSREGSLLGTLHQKTLGKKMACNERHFPFWFCLTSDRYFWRALQWGWFRKCRVKRDASRR